MNATIHYLHKQPAVSDDDDTALLVSYLNDGDDGGKRPPGKPIPIAALRSASRVPPISTRDHRVEARAWR